VPVSLAASRPHLYRLRLYYFLWIGAGGFVIPFIGLFYRQQGLSGTEIGLLSTCAAIVGLLLAPQWGRWSDRLARPQRLIQFGLVGVALCWLALSQQHFFGPMALLVALESALGAGIWPLSDSLTLGVAREARAGFGSVRVWGSLGWAVTVLGGGWLIERTGLLAAFAGGASAYLLGALVLLGLTTARPAPPEGETAPRAALRIVAGTLWKDRALAGLAVTLGVFWLCSQGWHQFFSIYLDQLGASETVIGVANMLGSVVELPFMPLADRFVRRFGSHRALLLALALYALHMGLVLVWPTVPALMLSTGIGGVSYSFETIALVVFTTERAPAEYSATALALYTVTLRELIGVAAGPLGGALFDAAGAYWLSALALVGTLIAWFILRLTVTGKRSRTQPDSPIL